MIHGGPTCSRQASTAMERRLEKKPWTVHTLALQEPPRIWTDQADDPEDHRGCSPGVLEKLRSPAWGQHSTPQEGRRVSRTWWSGGCSLKCLESTKEGGTPRCHPLGQPPSCSIRMSHEGPSCPLLPPGKPQPKLARAPSR